MMIVDNRVQRDVELFNAREGNLNTDHTGINGEIVLADGIDCAECKNKGIIAVTRVNDRGVSEMCVKPCECMARRNAVRRLRESGLERTVQMYTFENFTVNEDWQKRMKETAMAYIRDGVKDGRWMYAGGQSGAGKTHICTAVAGVILRKLDLMYAVWPAISKELKAVVMDAEAYDAAATPLKTVRVLYIDDFLKPVYDRKGGEDGASAADIRLAYDIINARYLNRLPTIISSEWFLGEIVKMDEATAGRIYEMCGPYRMDIKRDGGRNYRIKTI